MNKFKIGDKIVVCNDLVATIVDITKEGGIFTTYWFKDEKGALKFEDESAIELYDGR